MNQFNKYNTHGYSDTQLDKMNDIYSAAIEGIDIDDPDSDIELKYLSESILREMENEIIQHN